MAISQTENRTFYGPCHGREFVKSRNRLVPMMVNETAGNLNPRLQSEHVSVTWLLLLQPVGGIGWCCQIDLILSNSVPIYTVFKKTSPFLLLRQLRQMLADLADFGHDYWSVNLQRPNAHVLVRNGNLFDSRVPASILFGSKRCSLT